MQKHPIIYHPKYKLAMRWFQNLHALDFDKGGRVFRGLMEKGLITPQNIHTTDKISPADLRLVHTEQYIESLRSRKTLSKIFCVKSMKYVPSFVSRSLVLDRIAYHAGGTIKAGALAKQFGWAINLGGGGHHASSERGEGFCAIADISISIQKLRQQNPDVQKIMIIDLDAHQGNGYARDFMGDKDVYIMDFFTYEADNFYPDDTLAMARINYKEKLNYQTGDDEYLERLECALTFTENAFKPDIIYYVAGTDTLQGDKLGLQNLSEDAIKRRDEMVFRYAFERETPIAMVFGGGYQMNNAPLICDSIENLHAQFGILG